MCKNVFKSQDKSKRKEEFTRLFAVLISNSQKNTCILVDNRKKA